MNLDGNAFAPMEAPEMVVYYLNKQATSTACTEQELLYIDSKMLPDIDMTLLANNYETPDWEVSSDAARRKLEAKAAVNSIAASVASNAASGAPNCDFCKKLYPKNLCNAMYNCKLRRQLEPAEQRELKTYDGLAMDLLENCQENIQALAESSRLSWTCRKAMRKARCYVEFV